MTPLSSIWGGPVPHAAHQLWGLGLDGHAALALICKHSSGVTIPQAKQEDSVLEPRPQHTAVTCKTRVRLPAQQLRWDAMHLLHACYV